MPDDFKKSRLKNLIVLVCLVRYDRIYQEVVHSLDNVHIYTIFPHSPDQADIFGND
jgi:hypothetical protein